jgi:hypothetical protein
MRTCRGVERVGPTTMFLSDLGTVDRRRSNGEAGRIIPHRLFVMAQAQGLCLWLHLAPRHIARSLAPSTWVSQLPFACGCHIRGLSHLLFRSSELARDVAPRTSRRQP